MTPTSGTPAVGSVPEPSAEPMAREWLATMTLIRRFEERAGEMYARAKIGGFLHLSIGEEATIVGSARALRDEDYLVSTYRSHGHALARGTPPGERDGRAVRPRRRLLQRARWLDAHVRRRPALHGRLRRSSAATCPSPRASRSPATTRGTRRGHALHVRRRRLQPGHVRRDAQPRRAVAPAGRVHGDQQPVRHGHLAARATPPSPTCSARARALGVPGMRCDGMDVLDTHAVVSEARARACARSAARCSSRPSPTASAAIRWPTPRSYRTKEEVARWRERDPIPAFGALLEREGVLDEQRSRSTPSRDRPRGCGGGVRRGLPLPEPSRSTTTSTCSTTLEAGTRCDDRVAPDGGEARAARTTTRSPSSCRALAAGEDGATDHGAPR